MPTYICTYVHAYYISTHIHMNMHTYTSSLQLHTDYTCTTVYSASALESTLVPTYVHVYACYRKHSYLLLKSALTQLTARTVELIVRCKSWWAPCTLVTACVTNVTEKDTEQQLLEMMVARESYLEQQTGLPIISSGHTVTRNVSKCHASWCNLYRSC